MSRSLIGWFLGSYCMTSKIRFATPADAAAVLEIYGPFCEDSPITFETERPGLAEIEKSDPKDC